MQRCSLRIQAVRGFTSLRPCSKLPPCARHTTSVYLSLSPHTDCRQLRQQSSSVTSATSDEDIHDGDSTAPDPSAEARPPLTSTDLNRALLDASSPLRGSTYLISRLLEAHPSPTSATYHAALRALAVHPSPFLLHDILTSMRSAWLTLTDSGHHDVAASLLRNSQLEEAIEYIEHMRVDENPHIEVRPWLWDMLLYCLLERGEMDEALRTVQERVRIGAEGGVSLSAWYALLDSACQLLHYEAVKFVWTRQVNAEIDGLNPSLGHCVAALRTCARNGDVTLANDVTRAMNERGFVLEVTHYELLMEAHLTRGDVRAGMRVLGAMWKAGLSVHRSSTRDLLQALVADEDAISSAWEELLEIRGQTAIPKDVVPTAAVDTVIEACVAFCTGAAEAGESEKSQAWLEKAIDYYKQLHKLCKAGPSRDTFNLLMMGCSSVSGAKPTAMFLASEMVALKVEPNRVTYDHLILVCLRATPEAENAQNKKDKYPYEDAMRYLAEMQRRNIYPHHLVFAEIVETCCRAGDQRAWAVVEKMKQVGYETGSVRSKLEAEWKRVE